jgi:antitoxin FitA
MATLTIRNLDPAIKERLRVQAARNGRSMEAELRAILTEAIGTERNLQINLAEAIPPPLCAAGRRRAGSPRARADARIACFLLMFILKRPRGPCSWKISTDACCPSTRKRLA